MHRFHNYVINLFILLILLSGKVVLSQSQIIDSEKNFNLNVKQFNEFIDRFNYKTDFNGNPVDSVFKSKITRAKYLDLLFNKDDVRLKNADSEYIDLKNEFIKHVVDRNLLINKYSLKIIAEAKSNVKYKNNSKEISIYLNQEIESNGVKWVLLSVKADFLDVLSEDTVLLRFIPPTSNETNFISLKRVFDDSTYQHYYAYHNYSYDPLSSFLFALNTGLVKYQYVNEIVYHIIVIDGWHIQVKEFNRNTDNSGWLINNIVKTNLDPNECFEQIINN